MLNPEPAKPPFHGKQETRFAVVIYGGVSLAIYINGIAQELLQMVRATATEGERKTLRFNDSELNGTAKVYRQLGQILGCRKPVDEAFAELKSNPLMPVSTQFVIDVLSGTSAGGINAIFLAKALVNNQSLDNLKNMWITEGDIDKLINDRASIEPGLTPQKPPRSLLNSQRMYSKLLDALTEMDGKGPVGSSEPLVDELDLFTTATDIRGVELPVRLSDKLVQERRHKNVFRFRYSRTYLPCADPNGDVPEFDGNDFQFDDNPFLAYAARCTSAFPFAFEPMALNDIFSVLAGNPNYSGKGYRQANTRQWQRFYTEYIDDKMLDFRDRPFGDGGYLDNKPFSYAVDTMLKRFPTAPVDRKLLYVEPNPEGRSAPPPHEKPDAFENSIAALLTLPRYETIRQDLERVLERNRRIRSVRRTVEQLREFAEENVPPGITDDQRWLKSDSKDYGVTYAAYQRLKTSTVIDELAEDIMEAFNIDPDSGYGRAIRILTLQYFNRNCDAPTEKNQFLLDFDRSFRLRKLSYTRMRIDEICREESRDKKVLDELWCIRSVLLDRFRYLIQRENMGCAFNDRAALERLVSDDEIKLILEPPEDCSAFNGLTPEEYPQRCDSDTDGMLCRARYLLENKDLNARLQFVADQVKKYYNFIDFGTPIREAIKPVDDPAKNEARQFVAKVYRDFEFCDSILFPIQYGADMGETDEIDVFRISPVDAVYQNQRARSDATGPKLKGESFGAFGAFLDEEWRRHDILWGRLDGAERLISALLPGTAKTVARTREQLIEQAHRAILEEELPALQADEQMRALADKSLLEAIRTGGLDVEQKARLEKLLDPAVQFKEYLHRVPEKAGAQQLSNALARSTTVAGYMLEEKSQRERHRRSFRMVVMLGRIGWSLVEAASPRTFNELLFSHLYQVAALCALVLLVIGLTLHPPLAGIAAVMFGVLLLLGLGVLSLRRWFTPSGYWSGAIEAAAVIVVLAILLAAGADKIRSAIVELASKGSGQAFWTACIGVLGAFAIGASIAIMLKSRKLTKVGDNPLPASPILELEFARDGQVVNSIAGPGSHSNRRVLDQINNTDRALAISYGLFFLVLGAVLGMKANMVGWIVSLGAVAALADLAENNAIDEMLFASSATGAFRPAVTWARLKFLLLAVASGAAGLVLSSGAVVSYDNADPGWIGLAVSGVAFLLSGLLLMLGQAKKQVLTGGMGLLGVGLTVVTVLAFLRADLLCCELDRLRIVEIIQRAIGAA